MQRVGGDVDLGNRFVHVPDCEIELLGEVKLLLVFSHHSYRQGTSHHLEIKPRSGGDDPRPVDREVLTPLHDPERVPINHIRVSDPEGEPEENPEEGPEEDPERGRRLIGAAENISNHMNSTVQYC